MPLVVAWRKDDVSRGIDNVRERNLVPDSPERVVKGIVIRSCDMSDAAIVHVRHGDFSQRTSSVCVVDLTPKFLCQWAMKVACGDEGLCQERWDKRLPIEFMLSPPLLRWDLSVDQGGFRAPEVENMARLRLASEDLVHASQDTTKGGAARAPGEVS